ncbi:HNH endonuclease signature motif containing protein [Schumannella soli]|nr:HNH endonuclease signature motif containing protein [Schumannella soli]
MPLNVGGDCHSAGMENPTTTPGSDDPAPFDDGVLDGGTTPAGGRAADAVVWLPRLVGEAESALALLTAGQVAEVRMLARAGQLAETEAAGSPANVRAHNMALRSIAAEIGGVLRSPDRTVQRRIGEAREIVEFYPAALSAWEHGFITRAHVTVIVDVGRVVPVDRRPEFEREAIDRSLNDTPNRVRAGLELYAEKLTEQSFTERHQDAARQRAVRLVPGRDGMCEVIATVPTVIGDGILDRLTRMAHAVQDADVAHEGMTPSVGTAGTDRRTADQIRADLFADLILAESPALDPTVHGDGAGALRAIRAQVQVTVSALTLLGDNENPADLVGRSPIDAGTARYLAGETSSWTRLLTNPVDGTTIAIDRYRPSLEQRRHLRARDLHCRFPGCRQAAIRCELDHTVDHALGGPTALTNLAHLCQRHHSMKQLTPWRVEQHAGGVLEWTSPTGRVYREDAPPHP